MISISPKPKIPPWDFSSLGTLELITSPPLYCKVLRSAWLYVCLSVCLFSGISNHVFRFQQIFWICTKFGIRVRIATSSTVVGIGWGVSILRGLKFDIAHWQSCSPLTQSWCYHAACDTVYAVSSILWNKTNESYRHIIIIIIIIIIIPSDIYHKG